MPIQSGGAAPYAPPAAVLGFIDAFRNKALPSDVTAEVLNRAGVSESLVPRTLNALENLDLIDASGKAMPELEGLRRAKQDEFKAQLEAVVRTAYAEVFRYIDPSKDDATRIEDQFRHFEPIGQRSRMVMLFMGLCEAAGIIPEGTVRKKAPSARTGKKSDAPRHGPSFAPKGKTELGGITVVSGIDPAINGLLQKLPKNGEGWTKEDRTRWLGVFTSVLDFAIPIQAKASETEGDE